MITLKSLDENPRSVKVGDVIFFRDKEFDVKMIYAFGKWLAQQERFASYLRRSGMGDVPVGEDGLPYSVVCLRIAVDLYDEARSRGICPDWLAGMPRELVRYLETQCVISGPMFDQFVIVPQLPYAGFGFVVEDGEPISEINQVFSVARLMGIRQLAGLTDPTVNGSCVTVVASPFNNTRYQHSLDTCAVANLIGTNCGLPELEMLTLRLLGFTHDVMTPAGGDAVKRIDPDGLDEDSRYQELFGLPGWQEFRDSYGLSEQVMADAVEGKGLLGKILDLADKVAYVGRDLEMFLRKNRTGGYFWLNFSETYERMESLVRANPYPCSVWECARLIGEQLVITDAERLADFLRMRALMFKALYFNAAARFAETGYLRQISEFLYQDGVLTKENLVMMRDSDLFALISEALSLPEFVVGEMVGGENPRVEMFATAEEALEFERQVAREMPGTMTCLDVHPNPSGSSSSKFNVLAKGRIIPFDEACPFEAGDIRQILEEKEPFRVFLYQLDELCRSPKMRARLIKSRDRRIATQ